MHPYILAKSKYRYSTPLFLPIIMPVSTERHSGFSTSKWELKYLRCRYISHRNKIASAKPAIDAKPPPERPHVSFKKKKALYEERRQMRIVQENLRLLDRTMNIMALTDMPTHFSNARSPTKTNATTEPSGLDCESSSKPSSTSISAAIENSRTHPNLDSTTQKKLAVSKHLSVINKKYFDRPLTAKLKRNTHIIYHWFIQRFGKYVPWWAEINY